MQGTIAQQAAVRPAGQQRTAAPMRVQQQRAVGFKSSQVMGPSNGGRSNRVAGTAHTGRRSKLCTRAAGGGRLRGSPARMQGRSGQQAHRTGR